jgi:hypothetical protein
MHALLINCSSSKSEKYSARLNIGEIVTKFGPVERVSWKGDGTKKNINFKLDAATNVTKKYKYMFQKYSDKADGKLMVQFLLWGGLFGIGKLCVLVLKQARSHCGLQSAFTIYMLH